MPIAVIGAGAWGTALALLLARNGNTVRLWGHNLEYQREMASQNENARFLPGFYFPETLQVVSTLSAAIKDIQDILIVVPSYGFRSVINNLVPLVKKPRIVWGTKGLDPSTHHLLHQVVFEFFSDKTPIAVLSGPSFAKEVAEAKPTAVSLVGNDPVFREDLMARLHNQYFRIYQNTDLVGLQLCGVLKNILAIAVGIADGLDLGANTQAALVTRGLVEMGRLCDAMGAQRNTLMSLAGVGDLILTCMNNQSRNRRFGQAIGQGYEIKVAEQKIGQAVEGLHNVKQVYELAQRHGIEMPITDCVYRILFKSLDPQTVVSELLSRAPKAE